MTREQIITMQPGADMDKLVAKMLGFELCEQYSTDLEAAWSVLDHLGKPALVGSKWGIDGLDMCCIARGDVDPTQVTAFGETAPLAICRAALLMTIS